MLKGTHILASKGRLGRWRFFLYQFMIAGVVSALLLGVYLLINPEFPWSLLVWGLIVVPGLILSVFQIIKRLHDIDRPGWQIFLLLVPVYQVFLAVLVFFKHGSEQSNHYGNPPIRTKREEKNAES